MALSVNNNYSAAIALQNLNSTNRQLETTQTRINTGLKVASAKDDGALYALSEIQKGEVSALSAVQGTIANGESIIGVSLDAGKAVMSLLNEALKKAVSAQDETLDTNQVAALNNDFTELLSQISNIVGNANFNGNNLVNDGATAINVVIDTNGGQLTISAQDLSTTGLSIDAEDLTSTTNASAAATAVRSAIATAASRLGTLGAQARSLESTGVFTKALIDANNKSISNLVDADLAEESARLQALQIKQQLGVQALSIANQGPSTILSLFR